MVRSRRQFLQGGLAMAVLGLLPGCGPAAPRSEPPTAVAPSVGPTAGAAVATVPSASPMAAPSQPAGPTEAVRAGPRPPVAPRWAYEPWAWEDEQHTAQAVLDLVDGYRRQDIPLGAVIIDSPWATNYNTFVFGPEYPDPAGFIRTLHGRGVRVVLWATPFINVTSTDGPERGKAANYDEARAAGYFVDRGRTYEWWWGEGSVLDFFNPRAVAWWYRQMDRAFQLGVDGWKVDHHLDDLPEHLDTAVGRKSQAEYAQAYYRVFYRYVAERNPDAVTLARPYVDGQQYAPVDATPVSWVGDQDPDWEGLRQALKNILISAEQGYAVVGSDIGGFRQGERSDRLFIRWAQLGALSPLMENGGKGEHRPWELGDEVLAAYRYYAKLHHQLVPYLYSAGVEAHRTGRPIIRDVDRENGRYLLGQDLLVGPITADWDEPDVKLPAGARWHDYWDDDRVMDRPAVARDRPTQRYPLFIRAGAIIPMQVADDETGHGDRGSQGRLTLLFYPEGSSSRAYYPDAEHTVLLQSRRETRGVTVEIGALAVPYVLRIKERSAPSGLRLGVSGTDRELKRASSWKAFDQADEGWYYDATRHYLWARFAAETGARLSYATSR